MKPTTFLKLFTLGFVAIIAIVACTQISKATECPPNAKTCKILTLTPEEEQSLTAPGAIFDNAKWASQRTMSDLVDAWRRKLEQSAQGTLAAPATHEQK